MAIDFNGETLLITLDTAVTEVDVIDDLYRAWKDWMLSDPRNRRYPQAFISDGGNPLTSIINQGSYIFLQNQYGWRIKPPEETITVYLTGNLAVADTTLEAIIPTTGSFTAAVIGLQPVTQGVTPRMAQQLEYGSYGDQVTFDSTSIYSLGGQDPFDIADPYGSKLFPLNNIPDCLTVANARGFKKIFFVTSGTVGSSLDFTGLFFEGLSQTSVTITLDTTATINNCHVINATVTGVLDGGTLVEDCLITALTAFDGLVVRCGLATGTAITLGNSAQTTLVDCFSDVPGGATQPVMDMGGSGQSVAIRGYTGGLKLINRTGTDAVSIDMTSGTVVVDSTVSAGDITLRGTGTLEDNSTGTAHIRNFMVDSTDIVNTRRYIELLRPDHTGTGKMIFWDPVNGDDTWKGDHIDRAVNTFAQAHTLATDNGHDVIIAIPGNPAGITTTNENIVISKNFTFLRGPGRDFRVTSTNDLADAINISGNGVEVSGMVVSTGLTSTEHAVHSSGDFTLLKNLFIEDSVEGIHIDSGQYHRIEDTWVRGCTTYGINLELAAEDITMTGLNVHNNPGDGIRINLSAGGENITICGDTVINYNTGWGITVSASSPEILITESVSIYGNTAGDVNDLGPSTTNNANILNEMHGGVVREIWLDTSLVSNGNGYQQTPYNNLTDAIDRAEADGITSLVFQDDVTLDRNLRNMSVRGVGVPTLDLAGYDLKGSEFHRLQLEGTYTDTIIAQECVLLTNMYLNGYFENCSLAGDLFCVAGGTVFMKNCASAIAGTGRPTISLGAAGAAVGLSVRGHGGGLTIKDSTQAGDNTTVEMISGSITFDASNTAGNMVARTTGKFVDATAGATVTEEAYPQHIHNAMDLDTLPNDKIADMVFKKPKADFTDASTIGGYLAKQVLTIGRFLGLK